MSKVQTLEPIVFLIDLDGTMIGNIQPQIDEYYLIKNINKEIKKVNSKDKQIRYNTTLLNEELRKYIIRPKLDKFLRNIKKYENIELFVYTASSDDWAKFIIPQIEKVTNFKFNRPLLTRNNIIQNNHRTNIKSINKVKPLVYKTLKKKYKLKSINDLKYITLIDNTKNVLIEKKNLVHCPTFDYIHQIDYLRMIPKDILKKYYIIIENNLNLNHSTNLYEFYAKYYELLNKQFSRCSRINQYFLNDSYWSKFSSLLKQNISNISFSQLLRLLKQIK
jgi:hypothetical protein